VGGILSSIAIGIEQVRHYLYIRITRMIQARKPESALQSFRQREVRIELRAALSIRAMTQVHCGHHLIDVLN